MDGEIKKIAIDYGIKLGSVLFIITVISYLFDISFFYTGVKGVFFAISILSFGIISILKARKIQNQILQRCFHCIFFLHRNRMFNFINWRYFYFQISGQRCRKFNKWRDNDSLQRNERYDEYWCRENSAGTQNNDWLSGLFLSNNI